MFNVQWSIFNFRISSRPSVPAQFHHAKECLAEYATAHLAHTLLSVHEYHAYLLDLKANLVGSVLHFYLEGVALESDLIQFDGLQHTALVALKHRSPRLCRLHTVVASRSGRD